MGDLHQHVGRRIRERRLELQRTQRAVAEGAGIGVPYLSQLESGQRKRPTLEVLQRLARALELRLVELLPEDR